MSGTPSSVTPALVQSNLVATAAALSKSRADLLHAAVGLSTLSDLISAQRCEGRSICSDAERELLSRAVKVIGDIAEGMGEASMHELFVGSIK